VNHPQNRIKEKVRTAFSAVAAWSDTPKGRLVRWTAGTVLTVVSIVAGHPWR
jgi:hypothetical protein